jgi:hypothetical protein
VLVLYDSHLLQIRNELEEVLCSAARTNVVLRIVMSAITVV